MLMQMLCMCVDLVVLLSAASHCARMQHTTQWITYTFFACWNGASKASHFNYYSRGFYFWTAAVISPQHSRVWFHNSSLLMKFAHYFLSFLLIFLSTLMRTLRHGQIFCWFNLIWFGCFFVCLCVCDLKQVLLYRFFCYQAIWTVEFVLRNNDQRITKTHNDHKFDHNPPLKISHIEFNRTPNWMWSKEARERWQKINFIQSVRLEARTILDLFVLWLLLLSRRRKNKLINPIGFRVIEIS